MLKTNELRVGNCVNITDGFLNGNYKIDMGQLAQLHYNAITVNPIPLTEEWLIKFFNIKRRNGSTWLFDFSENFTCVWDGERILIEEYSEGEYPLNHIKHVHQLQNLYFALTGEELVCK
jgi:hypothetical protein